MPLKLWNQYSDWETAEKHWDDEALKSSLNKPLKGLKNIPEMAGITPDTTKNLKWKSFKWLVQKDHQRVIIKGFLKRPFYYGFNYLKSLFKKKPYLREGDFFLYGVRNEREFEDLLKNPNSLLILGFSYCHKPFECPSGRFSSECVHDVKNSVCRQCFIGKCVHASTEKTITLFIPTIHYIGQKIFEIVHQFKGKQILFMITACEMTLEMFGDFGNMVGIKGVGVRLSGRICNTMKAFELSEEGIKPGLTVVMDATQKRMLELIKIHRTYTS